MPGYNQALRYLINHDEERDAYEDYCRVANYGPENPPDSYDVWLARAAFQTAPEPNTPIEELIAQYEEEECDFSDIASVKRIALRYAETMPDSHVRCLLYTLARRDFNII